MSSGKKLALKIFLAVYAVVMIGVLVFGNMKMHMESSRVALFATRTDPDTGGELVRMKPDGKDPILSETVSKLKDVRLAEDYYFAGPPKVNLQKGWPIAHHAAELAAAVNAGAPNQALVSGDGNVVGFDMTLLLIALNFLGLLGSLYLLLWDPILKALDNRSESIRTELETARTARTQADELLGKYNTQLDDAREQRQKLIHSGREEGNKERDRIIAEARNEAGQVLARGRSDIETEMTAVRTALRRELGGLAVDLAEQILRREVKESDQEQLLHSFLEELEADTKKE
jgi:F-type H+-transporting ATPase subunit b